ncbi:MAG TPA: serine/threonine-protein kinase [Polyangia bacterium]|nr:serine/threonine-protein kinase [Polyangia bacterium]
MSLIGKNIGNYRITAKLGEGGMGTVYLGEHPLIGKRVAVKVLLEELAQREDIVQRFFGEAKAVNDIGHPNIVDIVDFGRTKDDGRDLVYFIMEFLEGESLAGRLHRAGMTFQETTHVMAQACAALAASHAKGIVHRDLKPDNIFLVPRGADKNFVKLLDFGIAKLTGAASTSNRTQTGTVIGTPAYMSPEQCEGKGLIDHRSDIYSLGIVMYELLTGRTPFVGDGFGEILVAHLTRPIPPPSTINAQVKPELERIVMRALEKDRNHRFQTMDEMGAAIEAAGGFAPFKWAASPPSVNTTKQITTLSGTAAEVTNSGAPRRSRAPLFAAIALIVIGLGGSGAYFALHGSETPKPVVVETPPPVETKPAAQPKVDEHPPIEISITSEPPGARVLRADQGGREVGVTPMTIHLHKGDPSFDVRIQLDGYKTLSREVKTDSNLEMAVLLAKEAEAAPPPQPRQVAAAPSHSKSKVAKPNAKKKKNGDEGDELIKPKIFD